LFLPQESNLIIYSFDVVKILLSLAPGFYKLALSRLLLAQFLLMLMFDPSFSSPSEVPLLPRGYSSLCLRLFRASSNIGVATTSSSRGLVEGDSNC
jgi:hypothetical protein